MLHLLDASGDASGADLIDEGVPAEPGGWPSGLLQHLALFRQGSLLERPPFFYFADPTVPVFASTGAYAPDSEGPEVVELPVESAPPYGLITTQTCDLTEEDSATPVRPWVQVAPVFDAETSLDSGWKKKLKKRSGPQYLLWIPNLDGFHVADLRIEMPIEKGWLMDRRPIEGFGDDGPAIVGDRISRLRSRPALPAVVVELVQRSLRQARKTLKATDKVTFDALEEQVFELGVQVNDPKAPSTVGVSFLLVEEISQEAWDWCQTWGDEVRERCKEFGITFAPVMFEQLDKLPASTYLAMTRIRFVMV